MGNQDALPDEILELIFLGLDSPLCLHPMAAHHLHHRRESSIDNMPLLLRDIGFVSGRRPRPEHLKVLRDAGIVGSTQ
ncbi:hypothetical protein HU200_014395 [Digitaria exilis]|uniref:Uncharacterized protein n=1 Tax=Digitaria exilis TaxID=1010633 RepID=A0A835FBJ9_9POAL|nr:hypothetical protein HU200_014395 [Digitaria exilis]